MKKARDLRAFFYIASENILGCQIFTLFPCASADGVAVFAHCFAQLQPVPAVFDTK